MNVDLEHLIVLQAQDLELAALRARRAEAPGLVKAAEAALRSAEGARDRVRGALGAEEKLRRDKESELGTQRGKLERLRRNLDGATSAAQVSAFEHEISFARAAISQLEDEEFASLERTEALEGELPASEGAASERRTGLMAEQARAERTQAETREQMAGIEAQRTTLRGQIDPDRLAQYDRLSRSKGRALAEATGTAREGKCSACQMAVRTQRWQNLIGRDHEDEIFLCESCGRMLFWDPRRDTPGPWDAGERLGAAAAAGKGR